MVSWKFTWDQSFALPSPKINWLKCFPDIFNGAFAPRLQWCRRPPPPETNRNKQHKHLQSSLTIDPRIWLNTTTRYAVRGPIQVSYPLESNPVYFRLPAGKNTHVNTSENENDKTAERDKRHVHSLPQYKEIRPIRLNTVGCAYGPNRPNVTTKLLLQLGAYRA